MKCTSGADALVGGRNYIGPELTEAQVEKQIKQLEQALAGAEARHKAAAQALTAAGRRVPEVRKKLLIP